ncbi:MAG: peptidoglycan bridge formation glycyltransferase FemA/FemB family protein [Chloroflexi bacterium]|nr:peptidoglycan bridge formation glycyltransferase FemA/FemB family protein [Chloroflexota bacterium]
MNPDTWNALLATFPAAPILQTWEWAEVKKPVGWTPHFKTWEQSGQTAALALVLERTIDLPGMAARLRMHYAPHGPVLRDWGDADLRARVLADLRGLARQRGAFFLKIDPQVPLGWGEPGDDDVRANPGGQDLVKELARTGWRYSNEQVQFRNTVVIDLTQSEDALLANMKQKTRYNMRLAEKKGVRVRPGGPDDFERLYRMYAETAVRDGFAIRNREYYLHLWGIFHAAGMLNPLVAEVEGETAAGLMLFHCGDTAAYMHGMSAAVHREKMPTYLLQWEAMRVARNRGCARYDLWGAPEVFDETDSLWGVYRFKQGLGGRVLRTPGAYDLPLRPWLYSLYTQALPRLMALWRRRGKAETRRELGG